VENFEPSVKYITTDHECGNALGMIDLTESWTQNVWQEPTRFRIVGFDTETTGLDPTCEGVQLRLISIAVSEDSAFVFDLFKLGHEGKRLLREFIEREDIIKVAHNAKFDVKFVRQHLGVRYGFKFVIDTMLGAMMASAGRIEDGGFGLDDVVWQYLDFKLSKEAQRSDWSKPNLTPTQINYSGKDACILLKLWPILAEKLVNQAQLRVSVLEFEAIDGIATMELNGVHLDKEPWMAIWRDIVKEWKVLRHTIQDMLMADVDNDQQVLFGGAPSELVNLESPEQMIRALQRSGVPVPINPKTGSLTTAKYLYEPLALEYPIVQLHLDYKKLQKAKTSYGPNWVNRINPATGRIHANYKQIGAYAGRMSCTEPNVQQPPKEERYRRCFKAQEGHKIVGGDYSQFELRILADLCEDPDFARAFHEGRDLHLYSASLIFEKIEALIAKEERDMAKNNNFATVYGAGYQRFALMARISLALAEKIMIADRRAFPIKHGWLDKTGNEALYNGYSRTRSGRLIEYDWDKQDRGSCAGVKRKGKNAPIQGTNADVLKRAVKLLHDELRGQDEVMLIMLIHDEMVLECPEELAQDAEALLQKVMLQAGREFVYDIPVKVDTRIGDVWSK
jgi:DNA polymerase I